MSRDRTFKPSLVVLVLLGPCGAILRAGAQVEIQHGVVTCGGVSAGNGDVVALGQPIAGAVCSPSGSPEACTHAGLVPMLTPLTNCPGDADGNNVVNFSDITSVLTYWGTTYPGSTGPGDADHEGAVNFADITGVLTHWGLMCG